MNKIIVPVNEPLLEGNEKKYLLECLKSNYISSSGKYVTKFATGWPRSGFYFV